MNWINALWEFMVRTRFVIPSLTIIFFIFILIHVLFRLKDQVFMSKVKKHLRVLIYLLSGYVLFSIIIIGIIKDYILYPLDFIIYSQLCGAIILWCLFILNTILRFSGLITVLIGIPIGFFGSFTSYSICYSLPNSIFYGTDFGIGHVPEVFVWIPWLLLMGYSIFIGGRNLYKKIRGVK